MERTRRIAKWINLRHYRQVYTEIDPEPVRYCLDWDRTKDGRTSNQEGLPAYWIFKFFILTSEHLSTNFLYQKELLAY